MYTVNLLYSSYTVDSIVIAKAMASTASHNYNCDITITSPETGEILFLYNGGHQVEIEG